VLATAQLQSYSPQVRSQAVKQALRLIAES